MPDAKVPAFMVKLAERESFSRLALRFAILTAVRSGEVRGAAWEEFDLEEKLWTIPAARMKASREHVIPLSAPALAILERCRELRIGSRSLVFPGARGDMPMSRSEEHTSELQSLMRISYAVFCLKKKTKKKNH